MLKLDTHDEALIAFARTTMDDVLRKAHAPVAVAKRMCVLAVARRNRGRAAAKKRYPFFGICEASGQPLDSVHAVLDEMEPEKDYAGKLRWVCHRANNSGKHSCGACK